VPFVATSREARRVTLRDDERKTLHPRAPRRERRSDGEAAPLDPSTRAMIEDVVRELEFEGLARWASIIEKLRAVL
jgi:hypothetical protein